MVGVKLEREKYGTSTAFFNKRSSSGIQAATAAIFFFLGEEEFKRA